MTSGQVWHDQFGTDGFDPCGSSSAQVGEKSQTCQIGRAGESQIRLERRRSRLRDSLLRAVSAAPAATAAPLADVRETADAAGEEKVSLARPIEADADGERQARDVVLQLDTINPFSWVAQNPTFPRSLLFA